jgi:four helix bundle protein
VNEERGTRNAELDLLARTKAFALAIVRLVQSLPRTKPSFVLGDQLLRSGTSVAANYRAARRARSRREFLARMGIVEEEADESQFWLEMLTDCGIAAPAETDRLRDEAGQLVAISVASIRTARAAFRPVPRSAFRIPRSCS